MLLFCYSAGCGCSYTFQHFHTLTVFDVIFRLQATRGCRRVCSAVAVARGITIWTVWIRLPRRNPSARGGVGTVWDIMIRRKKRMPAVTLRKRSIRSGRRLKRRTKSKFDVQISVFLSFRNVASGLEMWYFENCLWLWCRDNSYGRNR